MWDLYSTDPTQEACPTVDRAGYTVPTRQHDLKVKQIRELSSLIGLDHYVEIDHMSYAIRPTRETLCDVHALLRFGENLLPFQCTLLRKTGLARSSVHDGVYPVH